MLFTIKPSSLTLNGTSLISDTILPLLEKQGIRLELSYFDSDPKNVDDKPVIVFVHGNYCSSKAFQELIDYFSSVYRVIAFDLLGHGESTKIYDLGAITSEDKEIICKSLYNPCSMIAQISQLLKRTI